MDMRIHVTGASGSGTTTLGANWSKITGHPHFDTDTYYWLSTDLPFQRRREIPERLRLIKESIHSSHSWILTGSLDGWGDPLIPYFDLVVFLSVPTEIRMARLLEREKRRYGVAALRLGEPLYQHHREFMEFAESYETRIGPSGRSRKRHESWLLRLPCPVLRIEGDHTPEYILETLITYTANAALF